ncbi:thioredoxin domain-containing protein [Candidatus Nomurabacteria bacterium]|nr:thioredoxin domain-containing protein [Candidatus Nomurabacteria bacterium]
MKIKNHEIIFAVIVAFAIILLSSYSTYFSKKDGNVAKSANPEDFIKLTSLEVEKLIKDGAPVLGNTEAKVAVVEFADFQCPYCGKYFKEIFPEIKKQYIDTGKIKFIYTNFAFLGEESINAARGAKCAQEQNKFWEYHDYLYKNQKG